jgi:hypothetical protein
MVTQVVLAPLVVNSVTTTPTGFVLLFNDPINPASTDLYSSPGSTTVADVTLVGPSGAIRGSLVIDPTNTAQARFVQTSGLLAPGTYTLTVTNGVTAVGGNELSSNYSTTFTVAATTTPVLSVQSFARGPGQSVALTDTFGNATGIPVDISNATGVTQASFTLTYNPTLLTIAGSGALTLSSAATTAGLTSVSYTLTSLDANHSVLTASLSGGTGLTATTAETLVTIAASVPTTAPYLNKALLNLNNVVVNSFAATGASAVDENAYVGNVSGSGSLSSLDASLVNQVGDGSGTGFTEFKDLDPAIIGGVSGDSTLSSLDASLINEAGVGSAVSQIPSVPGGITLVTGGPDPYLYLSAVQGAPGQTVTETLYLDVTNPSGIQLTALDEAIGFNANALQISDVRGASGLSGIGSYSTISNVDNGSGVLLVGQAFMGSGLPAVLPYGTDIAVLQFNVTVNADAAVGSESGLTLLQDGTINGQTKYTAISDNEGALTWTPGKAPSNSGNPAVDGTVTVTPATLPVASAPVTPTTPPVVTPVRVVEPVRRVAPVTSLPAASLGAVSGTSASLLPPVVNVETALSAVEIGFANVSSLVQPANSEVTPTSELVSVGSAASSLTKLSDPGAALSISAIGTNKAATPSTGNANGKASTSVLDEVYRQLGTMLVAPAPNGASLNLVGSDSSEELLDVWEMDSLLLDPILGDNAEETGNA